MKISLILSLFIFSTLTIFAPVQPIDTMGPDGITICHNPNLSATENFAMLVNDPAFVNSHKTPTPLVLNAQNGENITFATPDGQQGSAFEIKAKSSTNNYLFVIHEWWGLNDHIKKEAERLFGDLGNVNVLALDLYDGEVTSNPQEAGKLMSAVKTERAESIIKGALSYAGTNAKIFTIGWCFGGGWSLQSAILAGSQGGGAVMYYGMPESNIEKLQTLEVDVLGIWATERWINADIISKFEDNMEKAGKTLDSNMYKSNHAFANPSQPSYNEDDATDAYAKTLAFLKERLD